MQQGSDGVSKTCEGETMHQGRLFEEKIEGTSHGKGRKRR